MNVEVAVVSWNGEAHLPACLEALATQDPCPDVVVVDNASVDRTVVLARGFIARFAARGRRLRVLVQAENLGFTRGANVALRQALDGDHALIVLLNQDATLRPGCIAELVAAFERESRVGIAGCKIFYPDGVTLQHAGGVLSDPRLVGSHLGAGMKDSGRFDQERDAQFVTGAVLALRVAFLREVGLFADCFSPGYYEDVELCDRAVRRGWRVLYAPRAMAQHVESASFSDRFERFTLSHRNRLIFALPRLADSGFAERFVAAELEAIAIESDEIVRTIALASLQVLARLDGLARARQADAPSVAEAVSLTRAHCVAELRRRRLSVLRRLSFSG